MHETKKGNTGLFKKFFYNNRSVQLCGWILFIFSSLFFIGSSVKSGDNLGLCGGILFFAACIVFLIPFFRD